MSVTLNWEYAVAIAETIVAVASEGIEYEQVVIDSDATILFGKPNHTVKE